MGVEKHEIGQFIIQEVGKHPKDIALVVAEKFGISRQRAHVYLSKEIEKGNLVKVGNTKATQYYSVDGGHISFNLDLKKELEEDRIWSRYVKPMVLKYPENIRRTCAYGFTEILNNAIDHSGGKIVFVELKVEKEKIVLSITDNGIGIYKKIQSALNLDSPREAILHLSKGKFTTDPSKHTGQGIFFTSRMFDKFTIWSDEILYSFQNEGWLLSPEKCESFGDGTEIGMEISTKSTTDPTAIIHKFSQDDLGFDKTVVAVALSADPTDPHVSRSQAKRLMMGLEKFKMVVLDFRGVVSVGQAFVDEVFRVFQNENPTIKIYAINANSQVDAMIKSGKRVA